jgi:molecular chaperone GrpE
MPPRRQTDEALEEERPGDRALPPDDAADEPEDEAADDAGRDGTGESAEAAEPAEAEAEDAQAEEEELDPLARAERERDEYLELAQRTQADFENYRRRAARDAAAASARAKGNLVRELLPVVDNLERALSSADADAEGGLAEGVRLVLSEVLAVLERNGVTGFEPEGEAFDPTLHEAISTHPGNGAEPGTVVQVVEKGYKLDEQVIRPARVIVSA